MIRHRLITEDAESITELILGQYVSSLSAKTAQIIGAPLSLLRNWSSSTAYALPSRLRSALIDFKRDEPREGLLLIQGLPANPAVLGATPLSWCCGIQPRSKREFCSPADRSSVSPLHGKLSRTVPSSITSSRCRNTPKGKSVRAVWWNSLGTPKTLFIQGAETTCVSSACGTPARCNDCGTLGRL